MTELEEAPLPPTLGPQVVDWLEACLVHGHGDVRGQPYRPTLEHQAFIYSAYEVRPQGLPLAGRRVYHEGYYSRAKGTAKTEMAAGLGCAELVGGPVRADGFDAAGDPVGVPVLDPDIPFLATTLDQATDLAYARARVMLEEGPLADVVYTSDEEIVLKDDPGRLYVVTSRAKSKDGYIPTFAHGDEPHLFTAEELHELVRVVWAGLRKRRLADPWGLLTTTAFAPGERSVAELTHQIGVSGKAAERGLLFDHLEASGHHDLTTESGLRAAIREAGGLAADFRDVEAIMLDFGDPRIPVARSRRYWLNQIVKGANAWLNPADLRAILAPTKRILRRDVVALGFDGSMYSDATALIGCRLSDGHIFVVKIWKKPEGPAGKNWRVDTVDVDRTFRRAMRELNVAAVYADPPGWIDTIDAWHGYYGDLIVRFETKRDEQMAVEVDRLETAILEKTSTLDGDPTLTEHFENCRIRPIGSLERRNQTRPPKVIRKEHPNSDLKIDAAVAAVLAKGAAAFAIARGALKPRRRPPISVH